jgi:hypothetical protein
MRFPAALATLALAVAALPTTGLAQTTTDDSAALARRARLRAAMAEGRARADSAARLVARLVVRPAYLELHVGDSVYAGDLMSQLEVVGVTAAGDSIREFAKSLAVEPSPYVERRGLDLIARRAGVATLWIYIGTEPTRRFFKDTTRVTRVPIRVK